MSFERPRVRTDGPGGPDVKQGARIACLDCRNAKIRCSAPTDGKVPCSRCSRHGKDCVFEKHRRGRKPGRASSHFGGRGESHEGQSSMPTYQFDQGLSILKRTAGGEGVKYRREGLTINTNYSQESEILYRNQSQSRYQSNSANGLVSGSPHDMHNWSPASNSSRGLHSVPSSAGLRSASPAYSIHHELPLTHSRTHSQHSTHTILSASREQHFYPPPTPNSAASSSYSTSSQLHHHLPSTSPVMNTNAPPPPLSPRRQGLNAPFGLNLGPIAPSFGMPTPNGTSAGVGLSPTAVLNSRMNSYTSLTPLTMPRFNLVDHQLTPGGLLPTSTLNSGTTPTKTWLDLPSPSARALFSPSHHSSIQGHALGVTTGAPYWPGAAIPTSSTNGLHSYKRKPQADYFSGALQNAASRDGNGEKRNSYERDSSSEDTESAAKRQKVEEVTSLLPPSSPRPAIVDEDDGDESRVGSSMRDYEEEEEDEEVLDQVDEDEVDGQQNEDVLSTPLSLLAHASDAAAALKEGGRNSISERRDSLTTKMLGAATMGLISPPPAPRLAPPRRWFDMDKLPRLGPRLPQIYHQDTLSPLLSKPQERRDSIRPRSRHTEMAPPFGPISRSTASPLTQGSSQPAPPPLLSAIGRSRSYTAVESVNQPISTFSPPSHTDRDDIPRPIVTDTERRAEVLGEGILLAAKKLDEVMDPGNSLAPSTLDHEAWEYRDGRARARKSISNSSGPGTVQSELSGRGTVSTTLATSEGVKRKTSISPATASVKLPDVSENEIEVNDKGKEGNPLNIAPRRWKVLRTKSANQEGFNTNFNVDDLDAASEESESLGASHQDFFSLSIYHSKMDNESDMDPVNHGILEIRDVEKLFDIFFARVNPVLNLLDPFLHSVNYVRNRSALLTTVISALAARLSDTARDAQLAVRLERYWRHHLLPEVLLGGFKSVELSQAFLVLSLYQRPTNRLADDRSWQYLGFAIRIATEVGVNRTTQAIESARENEQVRRRMRNRARLWISLFLTDRAFSFQTGRPWTMLEDEVIARSHVWHIEDFALPDDTRLVSSVKLTLLMADHVIALREVTQHSKARPSLVESSNPYQWKEDIKGLQYCLSKGLADLERWRDVWCVGALEDRFDGTQTQAVAHLLDQWQGSATRIYYYYRLSLCSRVLQSLERILSFEIAKAEEKSNEERSKVIKEEIATHIRRVSTDAWQSSIDMIESLLEGEEHEDLAAAPNQKSVTFIYGALAALRLTRSTHFREIDENCLDAAITLDKCKALAQALIKAGTTPNHRNGAAASYGAYLDGILSLWESNVVQESNRVNADSPTSPMDEGATSPFTEAEISGEINSVKVEAIKSPSTHRRTISSDALLFPSSPIKDHSILLTAQQTQQLQMTQQIQLQQQQILQQAAQHSVGDELWGNVATLPETPISGIDGNVIGEGSDPETMDRMWDYLTTYPDPTSGFPLNLWQPHSNWAIAGTKHQAQLAPSM